MLQKQRHWRSLSHSLRGRGMLSAVDDVGLCSPRKASLSGFIYSLPVVVRDTGCSLWPCLPCCYTAPSCLSILTHNPWFRLFTSVRILFRDIVGIPPKTLLVHADREPWDRDCDSDSGGAHLNYRVNTDIGLFLFHDRTFFVVFIIYRIVVCTIIQ